MTANFWPSLKVDAEDEDEDEEEDEDEDGLQNYKLTSYEKAQQY